MKEDIKLNSKCDVQVRKMSQYILDLIITTIISEAGQNRKGIVGKMKEV